MNIIIIGIIISFITIHNGVIIISVLFFLIIENIVILNTFAK